MTKKKNTNPIGKASLPAVAPKKGPARKPKAKAAATSQLKATILSAPRAIKLDSAQSFMRTTAFTLQNKVRTTMTDQSKIENSNKTPSARLGLGVDSSVQPVSRVSALSNPFHRFKIAFLSVVLLGGIGGYFFFDRVMDGFHSLGSAFSKVSHEKNWVSGMLTQTNGIPEDNDKEGSLMPPRMMEETVMPVAEEAGTAPAAVSDVLPAEPTPAPAAAVAAPAAPVAKAAPEVKAPKGAKAAKKGKASKAKAKAKPKDKAKKSAQK